MVLAVPVMALEMGGHLTNLYMLVPTETANWISARSGDAGRAVGRLAVFRAGAGVAQEPQSQYVHADRHGDGRGLGLQRGRNGRAQSVPTGLQGHGRGRRDLFEAAAVITVLVLLGQVLELRAREQTGGAIRALLDLAPKTARRIRADSTDEEIALEAVAVGERLRVRPAKRCRSTAN